MLRRPVSRSNRLRYFRERERERERGREREGERERERGRESVCVCEISKTSRRCDEFQKKPCDPQARTQRPTANVTMLCHLALLSLHVVVSVRSIGLKAVPPPHVGYASRKPCCGRWEAIDPHNRRFSLVALSRIGKRGVGAKHTCGKFAPRLHMPRAWCVTLSAPASAHRSWGLRA